LTAVLLKKVHTFVYLFLSFVVIFVVLAAADDEETEEVEKIAPPPGVTVRDVELFKKVQQTTSEVK
jgi:succinate-acetate transporter protein